MKNTNFVHQHRDSAVAALFFTLWAMVLMLAATPTLLAADIQKTDDANALNIGSSWVGGVTPAGNDVATFDSTITAARGPAIGASANWKGMKLTNPGGAVTIAATTGAELTNGPAGIDLSAASQDLTISCTMQIGADQTWNAASGRTINATVNFPFVNNNGALADCPRGVVNFTGAGTNKVANAVANGVLRAFAVYDQTNWVAKDANSKLVPYAAYTTLANNTAIASASTANYQILDSTGTTSQTNTWAGTVSLNTLRIANSNATFINCTASGNARFDILDGLLICPGSGPVTFNLGTTTTPDSSTCRFRPRLASGAFFFIQHSTNGDLTLNIPIHANADPANHTNVVVKSGAGRLILNHPWSTFVGSVNMGGWIINRGTLSINRPDGTSVNTSAGNGGNVLGSYPPVVQPRNLVLNGGTFQARTNSTIAANRGWTIGVNGGGIDTEGPTANGTATALTISGVIASEVSGVGDLAISQSGQYGGSVTLNAANTYSGNTVISSGTLKLGASGSIANTPKITVTANSTFDVTAPSGFTLASGKTLACGSTNGTATVNATGSALTLASGALATFQANGTGSTNGKVSVTGDLNLNGNGITVNVNGAALGVGTYRLLDCTGTLAGSANATVSITGSGIVGGTAAAVSTTTGSGGHVDLIITTLSAPPAGIYFSTEPSTTVAGVTMSPAVVVALTNADGSPFTSGTTVTISLQAGSGTLSGTLSKLSDANGLATFNDLSLNLIGSDKQLRITNSYGGIFADSAVFTVNPAAATKLSIDTQPSSTANAGVAFGTQPVIKVLDTFGNLTTSNANVTVAQNSGGALQGTLTVTAASGVATFSGLYATNVGTIQLNFTSTGLTGTNSSNISLSAGADAALVIATGIAAGQVDGTSFSPAPKVRIVDAYGNQTASTATVTPVLGSSTGGSLGGADTAGVAAVNGTNTFNNLKFDLANDATAESGVQVYYTSAGLTSVTNLAFTVNPAVVASFIQGPTDAAAGADISPVITVLVSNTATASVVSGATVTITKGTGTGTLLGTASQLTDGSGIATFTNLSFQTSGSKTLTATAFAATATSSSFTISPGVATQLNVESVADGSGTAVGNRNLNGNTSLTVYAVQRDVYGNFVTNITATWSLPTKTGGVVDGDLVPAGDTKSAVFTGNVLGAAIIHADDGAFNDDTGTITIVNNTFIKANNTTALNAAGSWTNAAAPGTLGIATWDSTVPSGNSSALGGNVTWAGLKVINPGGAITIANTANATLTNGASGIDLSAASQDLTVASSVMFSNAQTWTVASGRLLTMSGTNGGASTSTVTKEGAGRVVFSGRDSLFTNNLIINGGTISATATARNSGSGLAGNPSALGVLDPNRTITVNANGVLSFTNSNDVFAQGGTTTPTAAPLIVVNTNGVLVVGGTDVTSLGNDFGKITLNGGTMSLLNGFSSTYGAAMLTDTLTVGGGQPSTISSNGSANSVACLGYSGSTVGIVFNVADVTGDASADLTVSAGLRNAPAIGASPTSLTKAGSGTMVLNAVNSYTGKTIVTNGNLCVNGSLTAGSAVTVANGATLSGVGTVGGAVTSVGGTISPGAGVGKLTIGSLSLDSGSTNYFEFDVAGSTNDTLNVNGNLTAGGSKIAVNITGGTLASGTYRLVNYTGTKTGSYDTGLSVVGTAAGSIRVRENVAGQVNLVVNSAPVAVADTFTRTAGLSIKIAKVALVANDTDIDGDTVTFDSFSSTNVNITADATNIYVPANTLAESFTYTVIDNQGGTNTGTVNIVIGTATGQGTGSINTTGGNPNLTFFGIPGNSYTIQVTTDLATWTDLTTTTAGSSGVITYTDTAPPSPAAYYRLRAN